MTCGDGPELGASVLYTVVVRRRCHPGESHPHPTMGCTGSTPAFAYSEMREGRTRDARGEDLCESEHHANGM